jgi:hypothetical protein
MKVEEARIKMQQRLEEIRRECYWKQ